MAKRKKKPVIHDAAKAASTETSLTSTAVSSIEPSKLTATASTETASTAVSSTEPSKLIAADAAAEEAVVFSILLDSLRLAVAQLSE